MQGRNILFVLSFFILSTQAQTLLKPYLQTPTSTSIYVSWLSTQTTSTIVQYGISQTLDSVIIGDYENISGKIWHSVKLIHLTPNTTYYYRCISGTDSSAIIPFHTAPIAGTTSGHIRFGLISDSQDNYKVQNVADKMKQTFINLYGTDWYNSVSFIMHNGDAVSDGSVLAQYETYFFNHYYGLSGSVPFMLALGNHEVSASGSGKDSTNNLYYKFMKYEDFSPFAYPNLLAERYYSFVLGNTLFITLNTNTQFENSTQSTWLENKLIEAQKDSAIDFVFVNGHHPGRVEIWEWGNNDYVQNTIYNILKKYSKVAMISHGHEHAYERGAIKTTNADNVDFRTIVCGGGGGYLEDWTNAPKCIDLSQVQKTLNYWHYLIIDIDMENKSYTANMYSLGNKDLPMDNILIDSFHGRINQSAPNKPSAVFLVDTVSVKPKLEASAYLGVDSIMSSQFQITATLGNYTTTLADKTRDNENYFKDRGAPNYSPINRNASFILSSYQTTITLTEGKTYGWRVRYRDQNLKWSPWSDEATFMALGTGINEKEGVNSKLAIYPNPYKNETTIEFYQKETGHVVVELYNEFGSLVKTLLNDTCFKGKQKIIVDNQLSPGIYFCKIKSADFYYFERIILQH